MKVFYILIPLIFTGITSYGQFGAQQIISTEAYTAGSVYSADIDGDGYQDVLSASRGDGRLDWYKNNGQGDFGPPLLIGVVPYVDWIRAADLDGDGDMDILSLDKSNDKLVWFENLDGLGNFSAQKIINTEVDLPMQIMAADIDGDGDQDVLSISKYDTKVAWYENLDGLGNFGDQNIIKSDAFQAVFASDIDGDGDIDVLAADPYFKRLYWYENLDGLGNFGPGNIIVETPDYGGLNYIYAIDIDNDGDQDVLTAEFGGNRIAWYENLDGIGSFGPQMVIDDELIKPMEVFAIDLDGDGDNDVLAPSSVSPAGNISPVVWYENLDGEGDFSAAQIVVGTLVFARSVHAADLDNDGDIDVLSASQNDDTIAWYENSQILGVDENNKLSLSIFPNPASDILSIETGGAVVDKILLYDNLGRKVLEETETMFSVSHLAEGLYLLKVLSGRAVQTEKIIIQR